ncbi:MAG: formyltetrahydrofolate deformylase [Xanthomonadales bacterium]|nr:formyltetrahydrofolate deformylase [Gammaproteobacteria bacterium]MBT8050446.1 formyltetrahydrofolate deformylase [Gammaproteobacteria bacterium]MBT8056523.1 formyltetrahydrofolate deformylase [Gammaproteobacteria bacterium]NNJ78093.1 formyltetrahydrofolate deformylase [Xanthomonadales bacterium]NNL04120.1 formyltetrahydrofolate deformylase [Xanthomonadales bacterium]
MSRPGYILKASCRDTTGIVAAVTGFLASREALILELTHFVDEAADKSFIRVEFEDDARNETELDSVAVAFQETVARRYGMAFEFYPSSCRLRTLVAVSQQSHCLNALLHRWRDGHLPIDIVGIVSNHDDHRKLSEWYDVPYHYLPIEPGEKAAQESRLLDLFEETGSELLVLARYMQILSPDACERLSGRAINIHHSFLPGFKGARPYHQAFDRGVKLIGATAHYVTNSLDEGPIIEQDVVRVNHSKKPGELEQMGQDVESTVLNRAVRWHAQHRVFENGSRTIVLLH